MKTLNARTARTKFYEILDQVVFSNEPIQIVGKHSTAVLLAKANWQAIQETIYLLSIPGMNRSIRTGLKIATSRLPKKLSW